MKLTHSLGRVADRALTMFVPRTEAAARDCFCVQGSGYRRWLKNCIVNGRVTTIGIYPSVEACRLA